MKLALFVADEFKALEGGKTLAVGLFTDRVVVLNVPRDVPAPSQEGPYGMRLGLLACLLDLPKSELTATVTIQPPSGPTRMKVDSVSVKGLVGGSTNLLFQIEPFLVTGAGNYTLVLDLDGVERLSETFELRVNRVDDPSGQAVPVGALEPASP